MARDCSTTKSCYICNSEDHLASGCTSRDGNAPGQGLHKKSSSGDRHGGQSELDKAVELLDGKRFKSAKFTIEVAKQVAKVMERKEKKEQEEKESTVMDIKDNEDADADDNDNNAILSDDDNMQDEGDKADGQDEVDDGELVQVVCQQ